VNISKSEISWIAIRLLGVYFLVQALAYVLDLSTALYALYGPSMDAWGVARSDHTAKAVEVSARLGLFAVVYVVLGLYCLLKGGFLHRLIARVPDDGET